MITLHLARLLEVEGFGVLDTDIFWEEVALDDKGDAKDGIWVVSQSAPVNRFGISIQSFEIYSRYRNKITGSQKLEAILEYLQRAYGSICDLPVVPKYSDNKYRNVSIIPISGIQSIGTDENNKIVRVISGEVQYQRRV